MRFHDLGHGVGGVPQNSVSELHEHESEQRGLPQPVEPSGRMTDPDSLNLDAVQMARWQVIDAETLKRVLDRSGYRVTAPRLRVIEALAGAADHFSSEDLHLAVPGVGRATIFRTLNLLLELDIICQIVIDDGTFAYRVSAAGHHHHLICRDCAEVNDFHVEELEDLLQRLQLQNTFQMESHRLEVYGRCARCEKKSRKQGPEARPKR